MKALHVCLLVALAGQAPASAPAKTFIPYVDARPILEILHTDLLPLELRGRTPAQRESEWPEWVLRRDTQIRGRLRRGDEDSIVNFLLFGVTFTRQPRIAERDLFTSLAPKADIVQRRIDDLVRGVESPGTNQRLAFVRESIGRAGIDPTTVGGQVQARAFLTSLLNRNVAEVQNFVRENSMKERLSTLFRDRGLSSDTSIFPNFAIERALKGIATMAGAGPGIRRVAVIGPGLDFDDKREGYDFYPEQTIQPFALIDSLLRLNLAKMGDLRVTTFDLSPRVNQHLADAGRHARGGGSYTLELPRNRDVRWNPDLVSYWQRLGDRIGIVATPVGPPPGVSNVEVRAVRVRPEVVMSIVPEDLNIVLQRFDQSATTERFDLIVATNVLIYYDLFEQSLAVINIAHMLRPGGWFLTNEAISRLPGLPLVAVGQTDLVYSDQLNSRERLAWYQAR